jgi:hypothetical protein
MEIAIGTWWKWREEQMEIAVGTPTSLIVVM